MQLSRNAIIALSVLALAGLAVVIYFANPNLFKRSNIATNSAQNVPQEDAIVASDQIVADTVTISRIAIKSATGAFVVVNKLKADGATSQISVGNSEYLAQGTHENLKIGFYPLKDRGNAELKSGDVIMAYIATDDGDKVYNQGDFPGKSVIFQLK